GLLLVLTATCAWLLWKAAPAREHAVEGGPPVAELATGGPPIATAGAIKAERGRSSRNRRRSQHVRATPPGPAPAVADGRDEASLTLGGTVTFGRRLRWV